MPVFHALAMGCCSSRPQKLDEALMLLRQMGKQGLYPDSSLCNALIQGCSGYGRVDDAVAVQQLRHHLGPFLAHCQLGPTLHAPCAMLYLVAVLSRCGLVFGIRCCDQFGGLQVLGRMLKGGSTPSSTSYKSLIDACAEAQPKPLAQDAIAVYHMLRAVHVLPDQVTFNSMR